MENITRRVVVLIYNPVIESEGGRRLIEVQGWNSVDALVKGYISDVREASHDCVRYEVVERIELDAYPVKTDGFRYTDATYIRHWRARGGFHDPDAASYPHMLRDADFERKAGAGIADELWLFGAPYFGFFESCMGGAGAIWCNGTVIPGTGHVSRRFVVMGFSYERGVGEMLEDLGHRSEFIMEHVFQGLPEPAVYAQGSARGLRAQLSQAFGARPGPDALPALPDLSDNLWHAFIRYDKAHPGAAACGNVHFAPGSLHDYDWGNARRVQSGADDWLNYPDFTGARREMTCADWGHGDIRAHHVWWMRRFAHAAGKTPSGRWHNWWRYIVGLDLETLGR